MNNERNFHGIVNRLLELLEERGIKHVVNYNDGSVRNPWVIEYKYDDGSGLGSWKYIVPNTKVCDLKFLDEPVINEPS